MSKTTEKAKPAKPAAKRAEVGPAMFGRDIFVQALEREDVEVIFAYPGGASMEIHQSLTHSKIRTILPRHEQGGSFAAEGYARVTGKAGVCMGTSGPGATNLVTAIADAYMDSCPLIAITGQVSQAMIGRGAFQETDMIGVTLPIVKHSYLITDINDIPRIVKEAFYIAQSGRPGPVVIDFPKNIEGFLHDAQDVVDVRRKQPSRSTLIIMSVSWKRHSLRPGGDPQRAEIVRVRDGDAGSWRADACSMHAPALPVRRHTFRRSTAPARARRGWCRSWNA